MLCENGLFHSKRQAHFVSIDVYVFIFLICIPFQKKKSWNHNLIIFVSCSKNKSNMGKKQQQMLQPPKQTESNSFFLLQTPDKQPLAPLLSLRAAVWHWDKRAEFVMQRWNELRLSPAAGGRYMEDAAGAGIIIYHRWGQLDFSTIDPDLWSLTSTSTPHAVCCQETSLLKTQDFQSRPDWSVFHNNSRERFYNALDVLSYSSVS